MDPTDMAPPTPEAPRTTRGFFAGTRFGSMAAMITRGAASNPMATTTPAAAATAAAAGAGGPSLVGVTTIAVGPGPNSDGDASEVSGSAGIVRTGSLESHTSGASAPAARGAVAPAAASSPPLPPPAAGAAGTVLSATTAVDVDVTDAAASPTRVGALSPLQTPSSRSPRIAVSSPRAPSDVAGAPNGDGHAVMVLMSAMMSPAQSPGDPPAATSADASLRVDGFAPTLSGDGGGGVGVGGEAASAMLSSALASANASTVDHEAVSVEPSRSSHVAEDGGGSRATSRARRSPTPGLVVPAEAVASNAPRRHSIALPPLPGAILSPPLHGGGDGGALAGGGAREGEEGAAVGFAGFSAAMSTTGGSSRPNYNEETVVEEDDDA